MSAQSRSATQEPWLQSSRKATGHHSWVATKRLVLGLAVFLFLPSCSWIFVKPAKINGYSNPACSTSRFAPVLDTIQAVGDLAVIAILASKKDDMDRLAALTGASIGLTIYANSAIYGYSNTGECIENKPDVWDPSAPPDPDSRPMKPPKKKPPTRLVPEPGVMRSN